MTDWEMETYLQGLGAQQNLYVREKQDEVRNSKIWFAYTYWTTHKIERNVETNGMETALSQCVCLPFPVTDRQTETPTKSQSVSLSVYLPMCLYICLFSY